MLSLFSSPRARGLTRLFAEDCALCGARAVQSLCECCQESLPRPARQGCVRCAAHASAAWCGACLADTPHFDDTVAAFAYAFPLDRLVQSFKFGEKLALERFLATSLATAVTRRGHRPDLVVPLPLSRERLAERGFNQSALIAARVARLTGVHYSLSTLARLRHTAPQSGLKRQARLANVRGAFAARGELAGRSVAVVDDVMTTGATLSEAARALKRAGALRVSAWVLARADEGDEGEEGGASDSPGAP